MAGARESLFSTIKCSLCNADVEISLMGDHVCLSAKEGNTEPSQRKCEEFLFSSLLFDFHRVFGGVNG